MNDMVLAIYSDRLFMAAVGVYVLAMVLHAAEYATVRAARTPATEARPADVPVTVAAAAVPDDRAARPGTPPGSDPDDGAVGRSLPDDSAARRETPTRTRADRFGGAAVNLVVLAALLQLGSIVCRGLATDRWPLGNMYEFTSAVCLAAVVTWLVVLRRLPALRAVALFVLLPVVVLLFLAGTVLYARAAPVVPALRSYWLVVHVTTISDLVRPAARPGRGEPAVPAAPVRPGRAALADAAAVGRDPGPAGLPHHDRRVPAVHVRRDRRCDLGGGGVGPVLGLGPQGDRRVRRLGRLRRLPARPRDRGLARRPGRLDQRRRASRSCCSTSSSSTWSSPACTPTPGSDLSRRP